jgi:hypothetical protein
LREGSAFGRGPRGLDWHAETHAVALTEAV